jgi:periplasmic divalent cation tolerance protein
MTDKVVVMNSCSSADEARRVARSLVELKLAACVHVTPAVNSIYRWKGAHRLLPELQTALTRLHSYELPEIIALPVIDGSQNYLNWLDAETGGSLDA